MYVGCDPGVSGALAFFDKRGCPVRVADMPTRLRKRGKGNEVDTSDLYFLLSKHSTAYAAIEYANAAPMQGRRPGAQSMFNFGESYGIARSLLELKSQSVILVVPADWKAHFGLLRQEKELVATDSNGVHHAGRPPRRGSGVVVSRAPRPIFKVAEVAPQEHTTRNSLSTAPSGRFKTFTSVGIGACP